ncbi:MAG TPA: KUP/HAK/KT family potassium transporter [Candidatus Didemnitutus sp.]|nr:KUP/HAK/KT family potassium transporter [Candidatus Didemnitutus sp.]
MTIGALGVVFGDIGTSPLYALRECVHALPEGNTQTGILGALSLVFWSLFLVVCVKYLTVIMRADNHGEGGIFALLALANTEGRKKTGLGVFTIVVLFGAALLYGDGVITPAVSVLGAVEGLKSFSATYEEGAIVIISCAILILLFAFQSKGTKAIGGVFGPIMLLWFVAIGATGLWHLVHNPAVLAAVNPLWGLRLLREYPGSASAILGAVVLSVTGAEALYADMGHFGRRTISYAWYGVAYPALVLNYLGQGAHALTHPGDIDTLFFTLVPDGAPRILYTVLSIFAAIIASQALITGTYSLTRQAIQLGYFPRLKVQYTNRDQSGQIYLPLVNSTLAFCTLAVVLIFRSSDRLAAAYGIAVTGTMLITTIAFWRVARVRWKWPIWRALPICLLFIAVESAFFVANLHKFADGGWLPILIAVGLLIIMHTWKVGKSEIFRRVYANEITEDELVSIACSDRLVRVRGTAVFLAGNPTGTPLVLLHHVKANKVLHETVILLSILTDDVPSVPADRRVETRDISKGVWRVIAHYGYMESPDVSDLIGRIREAGVPLKPNEATYYFNREMIITGGDSRMWHWEKRFYSLLSRNARPVRDYYQLPHMQIIEIGLPIQL